MNVTHVSSPALRPPIRVALPGPRLVARRVRRRRGVAMATGGRDDGGREDVEKEEERSQEEDETETPVDGQLQRRHDRSLSG